MNKKVFISYAHKDNEAAKDLFKRLSEKGVQAWLDEHELRPGKAWEEQIRKALVGSETLAVVLGEGAPSPNVLVEAGMALAQGKKIFPIVVDENADLTIFSNLQEVNAIGQNGIESAAEQIAGFVSQIDIPI